MRESSLPVLFLYLEKREIWGKIENRAGKRHLERKRDIKIERKSGKVKNRNIPDRMTCEKKREGSEKIGRDLGERE